MNITVMWSMKVACVTVISLMMSGLAYELCFMDTTLGGWIPFTAITLAAFAGFLIAIIPDSEVTEYDDNNTDIDRNGDVNLDRFNSDRHS